MPISATGAEYRYHVFLSYTRNPDYRLARNVESFLESFHTRLPARNSQPLDPIHVCLDGSDFTIPSGAGARTVPDVIAEHLKLCGELVVLCSHRTRESVWQQSEIEWFLANRGAGRIRLAITDGPDPLADATDFFPRVILDSGLHRSICYDLRGFHKEAAGWAKVNDYQRELVRLAADLNGRSAGEIYPLWLDQERRRSRRITRTIAAGAVLVLAAVSTAFYMRVTALGERTQRVQTESQRNLAVARADGERAQRQIAEARAGQEQAQRQTAEARAGQEQAQREAADAKAAAEHAQRQISDAYELLYRTPMIAIMSAAAARLTHPELSRQALETAYRVAIFRHENRRESTIFSGSGPAYLAGRWKQGSLFSVISPNGRYVLVVTERGRDGLSGPDGKPMPGEVYLLDNETMRTVKLEPDGDGVGRRLEHAGFDSATSRVFVARHYYINAYSLDGNRVSHADLSCCTKSPVHLVDGYFGGKLMITAESTGGVWLVDPEAQKHLELRREFAGDPVVSTAISSGGKFAVLMTESGRAFLLAGNNQKLVDLAPQGTILSAAFNPRQEDGFITTGFDGHAKAWRIESGRPVETATYRGVSLDLDSAVYSPDGSQVIAIGADRAVYSLAGGTASVLLDYSKSIDWAATRRIPNAFGPIQIPATDKLQGEPVPFPPADVEVSRIQRAGGDDWLLSTRDFGDAGPAYRVQGSRAVPVTGNKKITAIEEHAGAVWLLEQGGCAWRVEPDGVTPLPAPGVSVNRIVSSSGAVWFATSKGAFRLLDNKLERMTPPSYNVTDLTEIEGRVWVATASSGAYVIDGNRLLRATEDFVTVRRIVGHEGTPWLLTGGLNSLGPAFLADAIPPRPMPNRRARISDIFVSGDNVFLLADEGLYRIQKGRIAKIGGIGKVRRLAMVGRETWAFESNPVSIGRAFRIIDDQAVPVLGADGRGISDALAIDGRVWAYIDNGKGVFAAGRLDGDRFTTFDIPGASVNAVAMVQGRLWIAASTGAYWLEGETIRQAAGSEGLDVRRIMERNGQTWLFTGPGPAFLLGSNTPVPDAKTRVRDIVEVSGQQYFLTEMSFRSGPLVPVPKGR